jgi:hypothetical protein
MAESLAGVFGYRKQRWNSLGMQGRVITIRDGTLRVIDKNGEEQEHVPLAGAQVELKRGLVEVIAEDCRFFVFGYPAINRLPDELIIRAAQEQPHDIVGDYDPAKVFKGPFEAGRALYEALLAHGASPRR